jgi:UDPglucose 6-dehydrogenase
MNICVFGLWHLGCVTAACLADAGYRTVGLDLDAKRVSELKAGRPPLFEPGLDSLIAKGIASSLLNFSSDIAGLAECDLVWVAIDTPVDDEDRADVAFVTDTVEGLFVHLKDDAVLLISSQLPAGTTRHIAQAFSAQCPGKRCHFTYSPENLRLGNAIEIFKASERIIVGYDDEAARQRLEPLLGSFTGNIVWMSIESAEMVKHGLNAFLATSVVFANELALICERVGADARDVERALRLETRIGARAYIKPGASFAGGTLARDVIFLKELAAQHDLISPLFASVLASNRAHEQWPVRRLVERLGDLTGRHIAMLGLAYKPGIDTLRRSSSVALCRMLAELGAKVRAFDPAIATLPGDEFSFLTLAESLEGALAGADAAIVATDWPELRAITAARCVELMRTAVICDPNRLLAATFEDAPTIAYLAVGRP